MAVALIPLLIKGGVAAGSLFVAGSAVYSVKEISSAIDNSNKLATTIGISGVAILLTYYGGKIAAAKFS